MDNLNNVVFKKFVVIRNTVTVVTVISYIMFSMIKRLAENQSLYWIPFILICANLLVLIENSLSFVRDKSLRTRSNTLWIINQFLINTIFIFLVYSYLK